MTQTTAEMMKASYDIQRRGNGENDTWWVSMGSRVVSKHATKAQATKWVKSQVEAILAANRREHGWCDDNYTEIVTISVQTPEARLTATARRDLVRLADGRNTLPRYGPYEQLRVAGYVEDLPYYTFRTHCGAPKLTDAGRSRAARIIERQVRQPL